MFCSSNNETKKDPSTLDEPPVLPKQIELMYQNALKNIDFIKKQEWVFTTSALTAYGALYLAVSQISPPCGMKIFILAAIGASVYFSWLIFDGMRESLRNSRNDLDDLFKTKWLEPLVFRRKTRTCFDQCGIFIWLLLIVFVAAAITAWGIWKSAEACVF